MKCTLGASMGESKNLAPRREFNPWPFARLWDPVNCWATHGDLVTDRRNTRFICDGARKIIMSNALRGSKNRKIVNVTFLQRKLKIIEIKLKYVQRFQNYPSLSRNLHRTHCSGRARSGVILERFWITFTANGKSEIRVYVFQIKNDYIDENTAK